MDGTEFGRRLARRHGEEDASGEIVEVDDERSLLHYAEVGHAGDWTMRSALVRLAQRDPARVGALLQVSRRIDASLHHVARSLRANPVTCERSSGQPYPDIRTADLARAVAAGAELDAVLAGYSSETPLDREEELALPILAEAARFDALARDLADWADGDLSDPPLDAVDRLTVEATERLDDLGVPEETGPPMRGGRSRG